MSRLGSIRFRSFDYLLFLRELGMLLKAGLPVERALSVLQSLSPNSSHALRVQQILDKVRGGEALSQTFALIISEAPRYVARLLAAGEASGKLADVVMRLAAGLARTKALRDKLLLSLTYPAVLAATMAAVLYVVFTSVLPRLTPMFKAAGASLPVATQGLLAVGNFVESYGLLLLGVLTVAAVGITYAWRQPAQRLLIDRFLMRSRLLLGLPNSYESARFCRNLQTLLGGGLPLDRALAAAHDGVANSWFRIRMAEVRDAVGEGKPLRQAFAQSSALPAIVVEFAAVGEETGRLGAMIGEAADVLDQDVEKRLDRLTGLVLPIATLVMGGLAAAIMVGIVTGVLAVNDLAR
jgi:general secretion pathway protein F